MSTPLRLFLLALSVFLLSGLVRCGEPLNEEEPDGAESGDMELTPLPTPSDSRPERPRLWEENQLQSSLSLDISHSVVQPGTNVTVTCRLRNVPEGQTLVKFSKVVIDLHAEKKIVSESISALTVLEMPYRNLNRFSVTSFTDGDDNVFQLHIASVEYVDSGDYACLCMVGTNELKATKSLEVYQVPDEVFFVGYNSSDVIDLTENHIVNDPPITCRAKGVMPEPEVAVTANGRDVKKEFLIASDIVPQCTDIGNEAKTCPLHYNFNVEAIGRTFKPTYEDDGRPLVCRIKMRQFGQDVVETSLKMNVRYKPQIVCSKKDWVVNMNATDVTIHCVVYSNPPISSLNRTWIIQQQSGNETHLNFPAISSEYMLKEDPVEGNPNAVNTTLVIKKALRAFFTHYYYIRASNELGDTSEKLMLKSTSPPVNGADRLCSPSLSAIIVTLSAIVTSLHLIVG